MMLKAGVALMVAALAATPARADTDWVQLATNMIWCYQNPNHKVEPYADGWSTYITSDNGKTWTMRAQPDVKISRSRAEYVRDIQIAAVRRDAAMAKAIYFMCQRHSPRPLDYGRAASDAQWISAVAHAAACYSPDTGTNTPRIRKNGEVYASPHGPITCVN